MGKGMEGKVGRMWFGRNWVGREWVWDSYIATMRSTTSIGQDTNAWSGCSGKQQYGSSFKDPGTYCWEVVISWTSTWETFSNAPLPFVKCGILALLWLAIDAFEFVTMTHTTPHPCCTMMTSTLGLEDAHANYGYRLSLVLLLYDCLCF